MLNSTQVSRMVEASDLDRAFFVLQETTYADHISANMKPFNYEELISAELARVHNFLNYYAGDDETLKMLWRKYDYGNAKILIRALKRKLEDAHGLLSDFGIIDKNRLATYILKGEGSLPVWLERQISEAVIAFEEDGSPVEVDRVLDDALLKDFITSGDPLLKKVGTLYKTVDFPVDLEGNNKTIEALRGIKREAFGIDPLITFWLAKELEVKTIRQILISKKHHLGVALLKERIRSVYV